MTDTVENTLTLGKILADKRQALSLDLKEVSEATGIRPSTLNALEQDHLESIGAPVYIRSFIKRYASYLEIDDAVINHKLETALLHHKTIEIIPIEETQHQFRRRGFLWTYSFVLFILLTGLILYFWPERIELLPSKFIEATREKVTQKVDQELERKTTDDIYYAQLIDETNNTDTATVEAEGTINPSIDFDQTKIFDQSKTNFLLLNQQNNNNLTTTVVNDQKTLSDVDELRINVKDDCWVEIRDSEKRKIFSGIIKVEDDHITSGKGPFTIKFGNVQAVSLFELNGEKVETSIYKPNNKISVSRFTLARPTNTMPESENIFINES